jgi:hypothetical protein
VSIPKGRPAPAGDEDGTATISAGSARTISGGQARTTATAARSTARRAPSVASHFSERRQPAPGGRHRDRVTAEDVFRLPPSRYGSAILARSFTIVSLVQAATRCHEARSGMPGQNVRAERNAGHSVLTGKRGRIEALVSHLRRQHHQPICASRALGAAV